MCNVATSVAEGFQVFLRDALGMLLEVGLIGSDELDALRGEPVIICLLRCFVNVLRHFTVLCWYLPLECLLYHTSTVDTIKWMRSTFVEPFIAECMLSRPFNS